MQDVATGGGIRPDGWLATRPAAGASPARGGLGGDLAYANLAILTRTTSVGEHRVDVYSWRKREEKPEDEIVTVAVSAILEREEFEDAPAIGRSRAPQLKAPRFVRSGTTPGGIGFCADAEAR